MLTMVVKLVLKIKCDDILPSPHCYIVIPENIHTLYAIEDFWFEPLLISTSLEFPIPPMGSDWIWII